MGPVPVFGMFGWLKLTGVRCIGDVAIGVRCPRPAPRFPAM
jgi:hypothetical protein